MVLDSIHAENHNACYGSRAPNHSVAPPHHRAVITAALAERVDMIAKWIQIGSTVILASLSAVVLLRDWKCSDKRTITYRRFTTISIFVWLAAAVALGWSMWVTYPTPEPKPAFSFYINGNLMQNGAPFSLVVTNRLQAVVLAVRNHGTAPAERLTVRVLAPTGLFQSSAGWSEQPPGFDIQSGALKARNGATQYQIEASGLIDPTCFFVTPAFATKENVSFPCTFGFAAVASCSGGPRDAVWVRMSLQTDGH